MFFDVHVHLFNKDFNNDRARIIRKCSEKNIIVFNTGLDYITNEECLFISKKYENVFSCFGMHPFYDFDERVINQIKKNKKNIVGVGEIGLDYKYEKKNQVSVFKKMISLGEDLGIPLIIHSRNAQNKVIEMIKNVSVPVVLHSFLTSKKNIIKASGLSNVFFSIPASISYSKQLEWMVKTLSIDKLLCETDSPYLWKYGRNTPINVLKSYEKISELKKISLKESEELIENNVHSIFPNIIKI